MSEGRDLQAEHEAALAQQKSEADAKAASEKAKAEGRDPAIANLLKQLGGDNPATRAISAALYDKYGMNDMSKLASRKVTVPGTTYSGDSGEWSTPDQEVTQWYNKDTGQAIGDLGFLDKDKVGTTHFSIGEDGKIATSFTPRSHGIWDYGAADFLKFANMVPGLQAFTAPIMAARALNQGNIGQALAAYAPQGLEALGTGMMPQGPYLAGSSTGKMLESLTGIQGLPADVLAGGLKGAGIAALTGQDVGQAALMGAINPAMKPGMQGVSGAISDAGKQDFLNRYESDLAGGDINGNFAINNTPGYNDIDQFGLTEISPEQRAQMESVANIEGAKKAIEIPESDLEMFEGRSEDEANRQLGQINKGVVPTEPPVNLNLPDNQEFDESVKIAAPEGPELEKVTIRPGPEEDLPDFTEPAFVPPVLSKPLEPPKETKPSAPLKPPADYSKIIAGLLGGLAAKKVADSLSKPSAPPTAPEAGLPSVAAPAFSWGYKAKEAPKGGVTYGHQYLSPTWGQPASFDEGGPVDFQSMPDPGITVSDLTVPSDNPTVMPSAYNQTMPTFAHGGAAKMGGEKLFKAAHEAGLSTDNATLNQIVDLVNNGIPLHTAAKMVAEQSNKGIASLGGFSDGGRMLKGPGDGMSDDIPATIAGKQPARLANEEFVIPADVVSHLGNGSSEAGSRVLYDMMARVRKARTGNPKQGKQINPHKFMPR